MSPVHLLVVCNHVQVSAPEGFSAGWSALAHTIPRVADSLSKHTRFHHGLFGVDWTDYATTVPTGQLPGAAEEKYFPVLICFTNRISDWQ